MFWTRNSDNERNGTTGSSIVTMPSFTMLSETESSSSGSGRMERIRPEKAPRQRVQKIWRNVRWANSFPDESVRVDSTDITPHIALRKIALFFETKKYEECATLIRRMNCVTLGNIVTEVPLEVLYDSMPYSLGILEALYVKLYDTGLESFPKEHLSLDELLKKMVVCFAKLSQTPTTNGEKNCSRYYPSCRNILRIVLAVDSHVGRQIRRKRKAIGKCLKHLGQHGLVDCSNGHLMQLHDAMKLEFEKIAAQYRNALLTLDELSLVTAKHPTTSSVTSGKAPSSASHQRLLQMTRTDIQSRIIKNKTLYNIVEPVLTNQCLKKLMAILEKRIDFDKLVLFHDTELRKLCDGMQDEASMCMTLRHFIQGYGVVCQLLKEVSDDDWGMSDDGQSTDDDMLSPITQMDKVKTLPGQLNGFHHYRGNGLRPSIISGPFPIKPETNGIRNGHANLVPHSLQYTVIPVLNGETDRVDSESNKVTSNSKLESEHRAAVEKLEHEVEHLRYELQQSSDVINRLQDRERELTDRLTNNRVMSFFDNNNDVMGHVDAREWVDRYALLYSRERTDALVMLNRLEQLGELHALKEKILFSVIVLAFRASQQSVHELRGKLRHLLNLPHPDMRNHAQAPVQQQMDCHIGQYLMVTSETFDLSYVIKDVCSQIYATLYDYPCLKECDGLRDYVTSCVRVAWGLSVQNPPFLLSYDSRTFHPNLHTRFHMSDDRSDDVISFLWPAITEGYGGPVHHKAVVIT